MRLVDEDDHRRMLTIVGDDEADAGSARIGWSAPLARALIGARVGDERVVRLGEESYVLEITTGGCARRVGLLTRRGGSAGIAFPRRPRSLSSACATAASSSSSPSMIRRAVATGVRVELQVVHRPCVIHIPDADALFVAHHALPGFGRSFSLCSCTSPKRR